MARTYTVATLYEQSRGGGAHARRSCRPPQAQRSRMKPHRNCQRQSWSVQPTQIMIAGTRFARESFACPQHVFMAQTRNNPLMPQPHRAGDAACHTLHESDSRRSAF
eukprot:7014921-Prymnesium_polylepis.1